MMRCWEIQPDHCYARYSW